MSDFNDNWQLTGSSDPATPDIQPHQIDSQPVAQPAYQQQVYPQQPVPQTVPQQAYQQQMNQPVPQPVYQQPVNQPVYQQPVAQPVYQQAGGPQQVYNQPVMPGYGYPPQAVPYQNIDYAAEREKNLNECARMVNHFSPKVDLYQDYESCKTDIARYSRVSVAPLVWGIVVMLFGSIFVFSAVTANYKDTIIQNAIAAGIIELLGAGLITLFILKKVLNKKKVEALYTRLGELSTELNLLYNGFSNCVLPSEFTDPRILFKIQSMIISGRCVTIGNALNSLLSYHNTYMRINSAKAQFQMDTAERFEGKPAFFNAVRYLDLR